MNHPQRPPCTFTDVLLVAEEEMRADLLLQLAEHLESGKLGHDKFDFRSVSEGERKSNRCGTAGCAAGELPYLWPDLWAFRIDGFDEFTVHLVGTVGTGWIADTSEFFGISKWESRGLFTPSADSEWNPQPLHNDAPAPEVAAAIRRFVAWKQSQPNRGDRMTRLLRAAVAPLTLLMAAAFVWAALFLPADQWDAAAQPQVSEVGR